MPVNNTLGGPTVLGCVKGNYSDAVQGIFENCAVNELDHVAYIQNALGMQLCTVISVLVWSKPGHHQILHVLSPGNQFRHRDKVKT